jgi:uncharacterized membrane protein
MAPIRLPYLAVLALCVMLLIAVIQIRAFEYAFEALGIDRLRGAMAVGIVTAVVHRVAQPLPGVGIAVTNFVPALAAVGTALLLSRRSAAPLPTWEAAWAP